MHHALAARDVFGQFNRRQRKAGCRECADCARGGVDRSRIELPCRRGVAKIVRPLAIETDAVAADVQAGSHAIAGFRRSGDGWRGDLDASEPREGVTHYFGFQGALTLVADVRVQAAAAGGIDGGLTAIAGWRYDLHGIGKRELPLDPPDARSHPLAGYRALYEDDLPLVACEHPASRRGLLNRELDLIAWVKGHDYS